MVKKRGGRRGKATKETPSEAGEEAMPSTSQTAQLTRQPPKQTPPLEKSIPPVPGHEQPKSAWDRRPPILKQETPQTTEETKPRPEQAWHRGQKSVGHPRQQTPPPESSEPVVKSAWSRGRPMQEQRREKGALPRQERPPRGRGIPQSKSVGVAEPGLGVAQSFERGVSSLSSVSSEGGGGAKPKNVKTEELLAPMKMLLEESKDLVPVKPGILGRKIKIETNHVRLNLGDLKTVYRYDVSIAPDKKPKWMQRKAIELFRKAHFPNNYPSYDGQKLLYSAKRLPLKDDTMSGTVNFAIDTQTVEFQITIKITGTLDLSPLHGLLQKKNIGLEEGFQCVEVVFRQAYTNSFINVGRRFYVKSTERDYPLGCGAVMYLGGYQAAVKGVRPFLNVDVAHKAFTTAIPVQDLIIEMFSTRNRPITRRDLKDFQIQRWQTPQMSEYLKGLKVIYEIPGHPGSKKAYKVNALAFPANMEKFSHEGQTITVEQFFSTMYHKKLEFPNLPTLWVGSDKKRICIPMEYCVLKENQPLAGTRLIGSQTSKMINYSATPTYERKTKIQNVMRNANHNTNPCIQEFGFSIDPKFETLQGRVLDPPKLQYSDGQVGPNNGVWRARKFQKGAQIKKWTVVGFGVLDRIRQEASELSKKFLEHGRSSGMEFSKPEEPFQFIRSDIQSLIRYLGSKKDYDLIVVIIPPNNKESYYMVKQVAELQIGCLTQCIKMDTLNKLNDSTVGNILLKINCKMNGTNHTLCSLGLITDEPCMVMGADVTHPSPQARTIPSVVAVTASYDLTATKYSISVYLQGQRKEIIQELESITLQKLQKFVENCGKEPKRIYFNRDGVSDGEFDKVREVEIASIKRACQRFRHGYNPKLTFLVVQKRHHTRFFPTDPASTASFDKSQNVPVGTCVDTVITDQSMQNFYLQSHQSIRGVGRPTKYCTLYDENGLSNDDVEILMYYLCHLYTRCNRSVSYPAPTYFAHLAADRAKGYLYNKIIDLENLDQKLVGIKEGFASKNPMFFS